MSRDRRQPGFDTGVALLVWLAVLGVLWRAPRAVLFAIVAVFAVLDLINRRWPDARLMRWIDDREENRRDGGTA